MNCNSGTTTNKGCNQNAGGGYAFILVLFILIVLVGASWRN